MSAPLSIDWSSGFTHAWNQVSDFVPKLAVFIVILVIGFIVAKVVSKVLSTVLGKAGVEKLLEKAGGQALGSVKPLDILLKLVHYFILLIFLQLALKAFGDQNPVSVTVDRIINWLPQAVVAIVIVVVAAAVANAVKDILSESLADLSYGALLTKIVGVVIIALGVIAALQQAGIAVTVTDNVLKAVLFSISGILIVGVGGGLIKPMSERWGGWLDSLTPEKKSDAAPPPPQF